MQITDCNKDRLLLTIRLYVLYCLGKGVHDSVVEHCLLSLIAQDLVVSLHKFVIQKSFPTV